MINKRFDTGRFESLSEQDLVTRYWQERYKLLVEKLGEVGTLVHVSRTFENDSDIEPRHFIRQARHEFIFPKQEVELIRNLSHDIDTSPKYELWAQDQSFKYDETLVEGALQLYYDDSNSLIRFSVVDLFKYSSRTKELSKIPIEAEQYIDDIFHVSV